MAAPDMTVSVLPAEQLGGPGAADPSRCSQHAMATLGQTAGPGLRLTSLSLDVASHALGQALVDVSVRTDKRSRSIVFASVEARSEGRLVYSAQGLFSRGD